MTTAQRIGLVFYLVGTASYWADRPSPYSSIYLAILFIGTVLFVQKAF